MSDTRTHDENLILVYAAEEYALKYEMNVADVLYLFRENKIPQMLRSQYEVLHMLDLSESLELVESVLGRGQK